VPAFVVQKHDATRLHYDFRLEVDGVLRSWAVPRGPSLDPAQKRLAVEVEDHPLSWGEFEGRIGAGYGAGAVIVWDRGTYEPLGDEPFGRALEAGHATFELHGEKLHGGFALRRMEAGDKPQWLLIKKRDEDARDGYDVSAERPESVVSGKTIEEIGG
jgi:bifunctional non-homologous end joining protein LigD